MNKKLELIASGPGTGKTTYCIDLFRKEILKSPAGLDSRAYFVLPNREHAGRIQSLILRKELPGLFNVHILTLQELAGRFLGGSAKPRPGEALRRTLLRQIVEDPKMLWRYFKPVTDLPGFYEVLSERIQEFKSAQLDPEEFSRRAKPLMKDLVFRSKFRDFIQLMKRYDEELEARGLEETDDSIAALSGKIPKNVLPAGLVIFDGFYHFSQAQKMLVAAVCRQSAQVLATLTLPANSAKRPHAFELVEDTRRFLVRTGFKASPARLSSNHRVTQPELLHLEKNLFIPAPARLASKRHVISILNAETPHDEVEKIACEIRRLHRETDWHFSDMAVILRSVGGYDKSIAAVFGEYGIPVHIHERKKTVESGFGRFVHRFLGLPLVEWQGTDILNLLKSGFCPGNPDVESISRLERLAFTRNLLGGREGWSKLSEEPDCAGVQKALAWFIQAEKDLLASSSARVFRLHFITLARQCRLEPEDEPAFRAVEELLMRAESAQLGKSFSSKGAIEDLRRSIEVGLFSQRPSGKNRVQVYDAVMALPKEYRVVFIAGLLDQNFPKTVSEDPFFKDEEREVLNGKTRRLEKRSFRHAGERYFFYMAVSRARERLYLSFPMKDRDGRSFLPSPFIEEAKRCFTGTLTRIESLSSVSSWNAKKQAERDSAEALFSQEDAAKTETNREKAAAFALLYQDDNRFQSILKAGRREEGARLSDPRIIQKIADETKVFSATRLESFLTCAFKYFAEQSLKLRPPFEDRLRMEMGTLLHAVLEDFYAHRRSEKQAFESLENEFEKCPLALEPLFRRTYLLERARRTLQIFLRSEKEVSENGFKPAHFELAFGKKRDGTPAELPSLKIGKEGVLVNGFIDRVDISQDGLGALVIDYKLSKRPLKKKVDEGLEVQLPLYLMAVRDLLGLEPRGGELRFLESGTHAALKTEELEALLRSTETRVLDAASRVRRGDIAVLSKSCQYCHFSTVCRFEPWKLIYSEAGERG